NDEYKVMFIKWAEDARDPSRQYYTMKKRYDAGDRDPEMLYNYAAAAIEASADDAADIAKAYFATQSEEDLYSEKNWKAMKDLVRDFEFKEYFFVLKNKEKFIEQYGVAEVNSLLLSTALNETY